MANNNTSGKKPAAKTSKPSEPPPPIVLAPPVEEKQEETLFEKAVGLATQTAIEQLCQEEVLDLVVARAKKRWQKFLRWLNNEPESPMTVSGNALTSQNTSGLPATDAGNDSIPDARIEVSEETAFNLVEYAKYHARELAKTLHLLQSICIKDEITGEERVLRDYYIKQLIEDEARQSMEYLVGQNALLDDGTRSAFSDFLNGYIRNGDRLIPIPRQAEPCENEVNHEERDPGT